MKLFRILPVVASVGFALPCFAEVPPNGHGVLRHGADAKRLSKSAKRKGL